MSKKKTWRELVSGLLESKDLPKYVSEEGEFVVMGGDVVSLATLSNRIERGLEDNFNKRMKEAVVAARKAAFDECEASNKSLEGLGFINRVREVIPGIKSSGEALVVYDKVVMTISQYEALKSKKLSRAAIVWDALQGVADKEREGLYVAVLEMIVRELVKDKHAKPKWIQRIGIHFSESVRLLKGFFASR